MNAASFVMSSPARDFYPRCGRSCAEGTKWVKRWRACRARDMRGTLRVRLQRELAEQGRNILRALEGPQILKNGVRPLAGPAPADVAAELPFDFRSAHRPPRETRHVVDLARDALPVGEDRGHPRRNHRSDRSEEHTSELQSQSNL